MPSEPNKPPQPYDFPIMRTTGLKTPVKMVKGPTLPQFHTRMIVSAVGSSGKLALI